MSERMEREEGESQWRAELGREDWVRPWEQSALSTVWLKLLCVSKMLSYRNFI